MLEKFLNDRDLSCIVHNLGVPGYSLDQKIVYLEELLAKNQITPTHIIMEIN